MKTTLLEKWYLRKYHLSFRLLAIVSLAFLMSSCYKERLRFDKVAGGKWSPEFAAPIAYGNLTMRDIIKGSKKTWKEYPDGFLSVIYKKDQVSKIADKVIAIPDQSNDTTIAFVLPPGLPVGNSVAVNLGFNTEFNGLNSDERFDSILFKSGYMDFTITNNLNHDSYIEISIPKLTKAGIPFHKKIKFTYTGGSSNTKTISVNLKDYYLVLSAGTGGQSNYIHQDIKLSATVSSNPNNSPYSYQIKQKFHGLEYYLVMGHLGKHNINIDETNFGIDLFDNQTANAIYAEDPRLKITLINSYGLPSNLSFTSLYAIRDGVKLDFTSTILPTIPVNYPSLSQIGQKDTTIYYFTKANSNIKDIIELNPEKFYFEGVIQTNPKSSPVDNFALDSSNTSVDIEIEIPLYGKALDFILRDTTLLSGDNEGESFGIESLTLRVKTKNKFPINVNMQIYMTDSLNNIIDSVFDAGGKLLDAAPTDGSPNYHVTSSVENLTYITLTPKQLDSYKKARKLIVESHSSTTNAGSDVIKIYSDNAVYFEIAAKAKYTNEF